MRVRPVKRQAVRKNSHPMRPDLPLLGLDHEKLTFRHNGANRRLTDVHGHVIKEILA